jgi:hypothetical protein
MQRDGLAHRLPEDDVTNRKLIAALMAGASMIGPAFAQEHKFGGPRDAEFDAFLLARFGPEISASPHFSRGRAIGRRFRRDLKAGFVRA